MKLPKHFAILLGLILVGCGEDELTPNKKTEELLIGNEWLLTSAKIDDVASALYNGLTLKFTSTTYTTTNGGSLWPPLGVWEFADENGILRDDGLLIDIVSISTSELVLSFYWNDTIYDGGRFDSLEGLHILTFKK